MHFRTVGKTTAHRAVFFGAPCLWTCVQPFVAMTESQGDINGLVADDSSDSAAENVELTSTKIAHYRDTLCAVKPLRSSSSNTAFMLTRQQHIELLNVT